MWNLPQLCLQACRVLPVFGCLCTEEVGVVSPFSEWIVRELYRTNWIPGTLFSGRWWRKFFKLYVKQNLFFICRLEMIFAKFDEVQNSGGMILSISKGKNKLSQFSKTFLKLFSKALETKTKTFSNRLLYRWFSRLDFAAWNLGYTNTFTYCWSLPIFFSLIMDQLYKMIVFLCRIFFVYCGFQMWWSSCLLCSIHEMCFSFPESLFYLVVFGRNCGIDVLCYAFVQAISDVAGVETQA